MINAKLVGAVTAAVVFVGGLAINPAGAQLVSPFARDATGLNTAETEAMQRAIQEVLNSGKVGTERSWSNAETKRRGVAKLLRSFQKSGTPCGQVQHTLIVSEKSDRNTTYSLPFCRQPDGTWKIAF
ncbi:MAG TPA: hypothetical protein VLG66_11830 [Alphaproteobacteria bacterium]|jgi:surface antigen|nr:hypothetical protein [Pseudolabrys sp.]HSE78684.1 hypothetical protein [Alphaproteobacteria bacterium]